jgi:hypothetical protein
MDTDSRLERAIVLQLLSGERDQRWSSAQLGSELDVEAPALQEALETLGADGVVCVADGEVWASRAAVRLDELELIGI